MSLPKKVVLGTQTWEVVERSRTKDGMLHDNNLGYTLDKENLIVVDADLSESRKRQTLFHELLHAVRYTYNSPVVPRKKSDIEVWEHYFIGMYEEGVLLMFKDNPELLDYLLGKS